MSPTLRTPRSGRRRRELFAALCISLLAAGCATAGGAKPQHNPDPWEGFNRGVFRFNDSIDRHALKPVAKVYHEHVPGPVQTGVGNFFTNLFYPTTIVNQFLQGKFKEGGQDILRFAINTTLGWAGVLDVASGARLPLHDEDSGQTLGRWGVPPGPYLVIPLIGPATVRDAPARVADDFLQPFHWYNRDDARWISLAVFTVDTRARLLPYDRLLSETYDPYTFVRDAFLQRRLNAVWDGNPPQSASGEADDADWAEEALKEDAGAAGDDAVAPSESASEPAGGPSTAPINPADSPAPDAGTGETGAPEPPQTAKPPNP